MTAFPQLMHGIDPAMVIVTTQAEGVRAGCLVGFSGQSGIDPAHYAVWLSKANHTYRVALRASHLAVHFLTTDDGEVAERFGTLSGEESDKFAGAEVERGPGGVPLLGALPNRLVATRAAVLDVGGDHACFCLMVTDAAVTDVSGDGGFQPLRFSAVAHLDPGHGAEERTVDPRR